MKVAYTAWSWLQDEYNNWRKIVPPAAAVRAPTVRGKARLPGLSCLLEGAALV